MKSMMAYGITGLERVKGGGRRLSSWARGHDPRGVMAEMSGM